MNAVERLRRDHTILRAKLSVLEGALTMGSETWFVLREICHALSRQLQDHIKREEELVTACKEALPDDVLAHLTVGHKDEPALLRTINRLFIEEQGHSLASIRPSLTRLILGLRGHMDEEEAELFPAIEGVLSDHEAAEVQEPLPPVRLREEMTVNHVLHTYPQTKPLLERLFINVPYEGYDCLDEVAWRRGMDCCQFIGLLEEAISVAYHCDEIVAA